ncbi:hypothetical protein EZV62_011961 [Acer yangbiense]|uniref:Uncharacterized protein n=1 Tax=Acer yangbiense TaxID=1000413 RepID=A0A5C7I749_9ROSI|nr:hypothetical protein EZV62_011961 [Acer yangbiense]
MSGDFERHGVESGYFRQVTGVVSVTAPEDMVAFYLTRFRGVELLPIAMGFGNQKESGRQLAWSTKLASSGWTCWLVAVVAALLLMVSSVSAWGVGYSYCTCYVNGALVYGTTITSPNGSISYYSDIR